MIGGKFSAPLALAAVVTLSASPLAHIDSRGVSSKVIKVSLPHLSPAVAAIEDTIRNWQFEVKNQNVPKSEVTLLAGQESAQSLALHIHAEYMNRYIQSIPMGGRIAVKLPARAPVIQQLKGITIAQKPTVNITPEATPLAVAPAPLPTTVSIAREVQAIEDGYVDAPSMKEKAQELISREIARQPLAMPTQKVIAGSIFVAGQPPTPSLPPQLAAPSGPAKRETEDLARASLSWAGPDNGKSIAATLSGHIQLSGGLALTSTSDQIVIYRELEGLAVEKGQVWLDEGRFEIASRALRGRLVGQLKNASGQVIGQGEIRLSGLNAAQDSQRIGDLKLVMTPVIRGASLEVVSAYSYHNHPISVPGAKVWLSGEAQPLKADQTGRYFATEGYASGSSFMVEARADNHWGSLLVGLTGQENRVELFPDKMMNALLSLTAGAQSENAAKYGVIWGRVLKDGQPLIGARVEMAADHRILAHYFNAMMLPDRFADATGENGAFAFTYVIPGIQSVRVVYRGEVWPAQIIPVERGNVSYLEFEIGGREGVPLEILDPIDTGREINAILRWAGDETSDIEVQGRGRLSVPAGPGLMMLEADAGELYELVRYTLPRKVKKMRLPVVRRDWLVSLAARRRVNVEGGVGVVAGFDLPENFTVRLNVTTEDPATPEIVYFDANGQALFSDEGVAGGGFVIYNVPVGMQSVVISSSSAREMTSEVVVSSNDAVNVVTAHQH